MPSPSPSPSPPVNWRICHPFNSLIVTAAISKLESALASTKLEVPSAVIENLLGAVSSIACRPDMLSAAPFDASSLGVTPQFGAVIDKVCMLERSSNDPSPSAVNSWALLHVLYVYEVRFGKEPWPPLSAWRVAFSMVVPVAVKDAVAPSTTSTTLLLRMNAPLKVTAVFMVTVAVEMVTESVDSGLVSLLQLVGSSQLPCAGPTQVMSAAVAMVGMPSAW